MYIFIFFGETQMLINNAFFIKNIRPMNLIYLHIRYVYIFILFRNTTTNANLKVYFLKKKFRISMIF